MQQKTVIITGISRGIGRAAALAFAKEGYAIAGCCHKNKELLQSLARELDCLGTPHLLLAGDIADASFVNELFEQTVARFGRITLLINNAGISHIGLLQDMTDAQWHRVLGVNLSAAFYCCRAAIPHLLKNAPEANRGGILNISSVWGCSGASCEAAYSAAKAGLNGLTIALAKELAPSGITVNALACGVIDTDMNRCFTEEERADLSDSIPMGRFATPEEVADALVLLSKMPTYLTGQVIGFDGGFL